MSRQLFVLLLLVVMSFARVDVSGARQGPGGAGAAAQNPNAVSPAEFVIEPTTLINLGFEWFIQGDENRNASVAVSYRKKGESVWKSALPMLALEG